MTRSSRSAVKREGKCVCWVVVSAAAVAVETSSAVAVVNSEKIRILALRNGGQEDKQRPDSVGLCGGCPIYSQPNNSECRQIV